MIIKCVHLSITFMYCYFSCTFEQDTSVLLNALLLALTVATQHV